MLSPVGIVVVQAHGRFLA